MHVHSGYANVGKKKHFLAKHICPALWLGGCRAIIKYHRNHRKPHTGVTASLAIISGQVERCKKLVQWLEEPGFPAS